MTGELSKNFHGVGIGPLSKILAVKVKAIFSCLVTLYKWSSPFFSPFFEKKKSILKKSKSLEGLVSVRYQNSEKVMVIVELRYYEKAAKFEKKKSPTCFDSTE